MLVSILDSYFSYVCERIQSLGAVVNIDGVQVPQPLGALIDALDWPQAQISEGALYLLLQRQVPMGKSKTQRQYVYYCQWSWLLIGTDIAANQQAANRGDRYRQSQQIAQNLKEANFPGFCQKIDYSANSQGVVSGTPSSSSYPQSSSEWILWEDPVFRPRVDAEKSGVVYGAATVEVVGWEDMAAAAAITEADVSGPQVLA